MEESDYSKADWKKLTAAIAKAEAVVEAAKPGATSAELAASALEEAIYRIIPAFHTFLFLRR